MSQTLLEMGPTALQHRNELEEVKRRLGVQHEFFDCWIYSFLENKFFDIEETVAKLQRRAAMERDEIASYEVTDFMRHQMSKGLIQLIGNDRDGRITFYIVTARDKPLASKRDENKRNFDMWMSYGTRLRDDNKRCRITMLINQDGAGVFANTDMTFQMNIALRISKFFPGMVERAYICKMGRTLGAFAKTVFGRFPKVISEKIFIITDSDMEKGLLHQYFDPEVLPTALGGKWDGDNPANWKHFSTTIEQHLVRMQEGLRAGKSVKEWELDELQLSKKVVSPMLLTQSDGRSKNLLEDDIDEAEFQTCISEDVHADEPQYRESEVSRSAFLRFFLQQEATCRHFINMEEQRDRLRLADAHAGGLVQADAEDMIGIRGSQHLARYIPEGARSLFRFSLFFANIVSAILFCASTAFFVVIATSVSVTLFFGIFEGIGWIFPVGCTLCLAVIEGSMVVTRAIELTVSSLHGTLLPPLQPFKTYGPIVQALLLVVIVGIQFVIFCVYATVEDPLNGLRTSFATGWLTCSIVVAIYHIVSFPLGHGTGKLHDAFGYTSKNQFSELSLFLFFDITEEEDREHALADEYVSADLIGFVPSVFSILFGTGFMLSRLLLFAAATPPLCVVAAFLTSYVVYQRTERHSTRIMQLIAWMGSLSWMFITYQIGFNGWSPSDGGIVILVALLFGLLASMAYTTTRISATNWLFRTTLLLVAVLFVVCFILTFVLVDWRLGVFFLVMSIHCAASLRRPNAISPTGSAILLAGIVTVIAACVLVGWSSTPLQYTDFRSSQSSSSNSVPAPSTIQLFYNSPLCLLSLGPSGFNVASLALMNEIFTAATPQPFATDSTIWFPNWAVQNAPVLYEDDLLSVRQVVSTQNSTVIVFVGSQEPFQQIRSTVLWVDSMALSPLSLLLPGNWSTYIIRTISFASVMIPTQYKRSINGASKAMKEAPIGSIVTGTRITGGLASAVALNAGVHSITFGSPSLSDIIGKLAFEDRCITCLHHNVLAIGGSASGVGSADAQYTSLLPCDIHDRSDSCQSELFFSRVILQLCGSPGIPHI